MWNYEEPIPLLERYIQSKNIAEYERLIGQVNLASAYVETRHPKALVFLRETKTLILHAKAHLLHGTLLATEAENFIHENDRPSASQAIREARNLLGTTKTFDSLNLEKLAAVIERSPEKLLSVAKSLREIGGWENARDCDFQRALILQDQDLLAHLYYGTPHRAYRKKFLSYPWLNEFGFTICSSEIGKRRPLSLYKR